MKKTSKLWHLVSPFLKRGLGGLRFIKTTLIQSSQPPSPRRSILANTIQLISIDIHLPANYPYERKVIGGLEILKLKNENR
ncbi:hypothetical protein [Roseivirga pacifica]